MNWRLTGGTGQLEGPVTASPPVPLVPFRERRTDWRFWTHGQNPLKGGSGTRVTEYNLAVVRRGEAWRGARGLIKNRYDSASRALLPKSNTFYQRLQSITTRRSRGEMENSGIWAVSPSQVVMIAAGRYARIAGSVGCGLGHDDVVTLAGVTMRNRGIGRDVSLTLQKTMTETTSRAARTQMIATGPLTQGRRGRRAATPRPPAMMLTNTARIFVTPRISCLWGARRSFSPN
jgi:hypothetical protein